MNDRLLNRLCAIGIGIAPDAPSPEVLVRWELVLDAIHRIEQQEATIERLREALSRWEAVVNSVTQGHNKLGLNGYDIVDAELRVLRHGRELDAAEIERLRALGDGLYFALNHLRHGCNPDCEADHAYAQADDALTFYEEARRD